MRLSGTSFAAMLAIAVPAFADAPQIAVDIPAVHSLVAQVTGDIATPALVMQAGASPHGYSMRPSEAQSLSEADVIFWIGEALEPWLAGSIGKLAPDAVSVELLEAEGTTTFPFRDSAIHGHEEHDHDDHGHDHHGHDHGDGVDPHAWLDPENAAIWLDVIARELAELDPDRANTYAKNAEAAKADLVVLREELTAQLAPISEQPFVVFHDAYQYFEHRFGLTSLGAISLGDASAPSPARIAELQHEIEHEGIVCVFSEPQFNAGLVDAVTGGTEVAHGVLDPVGADIPASQDFYATLLRDIAANAVECLAKD
ncbi:zinc ABC transporter substrate-binding protein [Qingshengfaniella alkalisoli]|uniref:High-affinity zinc uptake system protein ZnuA n=1 Tax=Qingshengfaniella alkalisoli TaxID=2599296 RepID=A0A5B8J5U3_9RHOB|nr:zinc ABC transporter substrate-binding protein [Qingshengfaniella alkalisoli]QDY69700.1 zinc transporter [Qingshengfaniella alkalisoli]